MLMKWDFSLTKNEVGFFFFRMMMMGSVKAESCVDEVGFFLDQQRSGIFTRDKSDLGKVTYLPEVGEYICVGWDVSTAV